MANNLMGPKLLCSLSLSPVSVVSSHFTERTSALKLLKVLLFLLLTVVFSRLQNKAGDEN